jgi:hypothetical protein
MAAFQDILNWEYYINFSHNALQKILVMLAFVQGIALKNFDGPPLESITKKQKKIASARRVSAVL